MPNDRPDWSQSQLVTLGPATVLTAPGSPSPGTITLPPGTLALEVLTDVAAGDSGFLGLTGVTTGRSWYAQTLGTSAYEQVGMDSAIDAQLTYNVGHSGGGGVTWRITPLSMPPALFVQRTVSPALAPLDYQSKEVTGATLYTLVAGKQGIQTRVFGWMISTETGGVSGFCRIRDGSQAAGANKSMIAATPNANQSFVLAGYHGGVPITAGADLVIDTANAATLARVSVGFSQA